MPAGMGQERQQGPLTAEDWLEKLRIVNAQFGGEDLTLKNG